MNEISESSTGKSEDSTVKFEKWNFLPPELKREVMKKLNFNDIWSIRRTASTEHALADTLKPKFSKVDVITNRVHIYETDNPFKKSKTSFDLIYIIRPNLRHDSPFDLFKWICHHASIENMEIMGDRVKHLLMDLLKETTRQFSVKNLKLNDVNGAEINFYLSRMDSKLETIRIGCSCRSFDKLINYRSVVNARYIQIAESTSRSCAILLAQKWIDNDAKIDRVFETMVYKKGAFERFVEEFTSRIVYKTAKAVKIRTDNPKKHIKLELGNKSDHWKCRRKQNQEFIRLSVVRADQDDNPEDEREQPWMPELEDLQFRRDLITKSPFR